MINRYRYVSNKSVMLNKFYCLTYARVIFKVLFYDNIYRDLSHKPKHSSNLRKYDLQNKVSVEK